MSKGGTSSRSTGRRSRSTGGRGSSQSSDAGPDQHDHCGLYNLGLTAYINAPLQMLFATNKVRRYLIEQPGSMMFHGVLSQVFLRMETESERPLTPNITSVAFKPQDLVNLFPGYAHKELKMEFPLNREHDAHEFLLLLLQALHKESNQANARAKPDHPKAHNAAEAWNSHFKYIDDSYLARIFIGEVENELICSKCRTVRKSWTCTWGLEAQIVAEQNGKCPTLVDCLKEYKETEHLTNEAAPNCSTCKGKQPARKKHSFIRVPNYLIIHLKRFTSNGTKINTKVTIEERLELCSQLFRLSSVLLHTGSESKGHFSTLVHREGEKDWADIDDHKVVKGLTTEQVAAQMQKHAYVCLYRAIRDKGEPSSKKGKGSHLPSSKLSSKSRTKKKKKKAK